VDLLREQAERHQDKVAFYFSPDGDEEQDRLTYRELDERARAIAADLQQQGAAGERVLVFCRPGLDTVAGFFGCFYAGAVAVPVDEHWVSRRIASAVPDARAGFALATAKTPEKIRTQVDDLVEAPLRWRAMDDGADNAENWAMPDIDANTTAVIQYTSGSTASPKGVVLSHRNYLHNLDTMLQAWHPEPDDPVFSSPVSGLSWLPHFHDMGMVGGVFMTLCVGGTTVLMSPGSFLMRPIRWLEAISRHRAAVSPAPNFAYDLCVKRVTAEQLAALDLSNWSIAISGGEPVSADTLRSFADTFAPAGFRSEAFRPVYGQAEATLLTSGGSDSAVPIIEHVDRAALGEDRVVGAAPDDPTAAALVGCGQPRGGQEVLIVDPETRRPRHDDEVGEIWIAGPSVARGYWGKPEETEQTFSASLDTGEGPYLRTGDLAFLRSGEMFVTGRCKDLIIIRGNNYYPNDIELTVQDCHPALLPGRCAAFAVTPKRSAGEQLVVAQEVHRHHVGETDLTPVVDAIRKAITEHHAIEPQTVLLVKPMRIPTTSSGKIQRGKCRRLYLDGELATVTEWNAPPAPDDGTVDPKAQIAFGVVRLLAAGLARRGRGTRRG
jgi:acyl-CoA synthetase (AMP-forming)/AMP-acid ligase II